MGWLTNMVLRKMEKAPWLVRADIARRLTRDMTFVANADGEIIPGICDRVAACNGSQIKYIMRDDENDGNEAIDQESKL